MQAKRGRVEGTERLRAKGINEGAYLLGYPSEDENASILDSSLACLASSTSLLRV